MKAFLITIIASMFVASATSFAHGGIILRSGKAQVEKVDALFKAGNP